MIGAGYHPHPTSAWFYPLWLGNTFRYAKPEQVVVLADSGATCPEWHPQVEWVSMKGDIGHVYDLLSGRKDYDWCGWSMTICTTALMAYFNECDYIHKEADALAFGPWVEQIYKEAGKRDVMFGSAKDIPAVQSVFWVRHSFIPEFVRLYLGTGQERTEDQFGELKFKRLQEAHPERFGRYSFGFDRERPLKYDPVFYAQKLTPVELKELEQAGYLTIPQPMPSVAAFTGTPRL
jgi:hypothetical protein